MEFKKLVKIGSFVIFFVVIAYYLLTNLDQVTFNYFPGRDLSVPLGLLALGILIIGFITALIYQIPYQFSLKRQLKLVNRRLDSAQETVNQTISLFEIVSSGNREQIRKSLSQLKKRGSQDVTSTYLYLRALLILNENDEFSIYYDSIRGTNLTENYLIASLVAEVYLRRDVKISALDTLLKFKKVLNREDMVKSVELALELKEVAKAKELIQELDAQHFDCNRYLDHLHCLTLSPETSLKEEIKSRNFFLTYALLIARSDLEDKLFYLEEAARITKRVDFIILALHSLLEDISVESDLGRLERARVILSCAPNSQIISTYANILATLLDEKIEPMWSDFSPEGRFESLTLHLSNGARLLGSGQIKEGKEHLLKIFSLDLFQEIFGEKLVACKV